MIKVNLDQYFQKIDPKNAKNVSKYKYLKI